MLLGGPWPWKKRPASWCYWISRIAGLQCPTPTPGNLGGVSFVSAIHCHHLESFLTWPPCWWLWEICWTNKDEAIDGEIRHVGHCSVKENKSEAWITFRGGHNEILCWGQICFTQLFFSPLVSSAISPFLFLYAEHWFHFYTEPCRCLLTGHLSPPCFLSTGKEACGAPALCSWKEAQPHEPHSPLKAPDFI